MSDTQSFGYKFALAATWQGHISYVLFSLYIINPTVFQYYLGMDPGAVIFASMLYGNGVHIYTRPAMKRLRTGYRIILSVYGSYVFNSASLLIFIGLAEGFPERKLLGTLLSYFFGKLMYSFFYTYLYFVDVCADPTSRRHSILDFIFEES